MKTHAYRWVILTGSFLIMAGPFSLANTIHTLFIAPVTAELGFSLSEFSLLFTIGAVVVAGVSPLVGKLLPRVRMKWLMTGSAVLLGLGFMAYGRATALWQFYSIGVITAVGLTGLTTLPVSTMLTLWFGDKRGSAMGVAFAGVGAGTFCWMRIAAEIIAEYGFRVGYYFMGAAILFIAVPVSLFLMYRSPAEKYGLDEQMPLSQTASNLSVRDFITDKTRRSFGFGVMLLGLCAAGTQIHLQSYWASLGYSLSYSAGVGSVMAAAALGGSVIGGVLLDKLPAATAVLIIGSGAVASYAALLGAAYNGMPFVCAVMFGFSLCLSTLWPPYGVGRLFAAGDYAYGLGIVNLFFTAGASLGPLTSGLLADTTLGYNSVWLLYLLLTVVYLRIFLVMLRVTPPPVKK